MKPVYVLLEVIFLCSCQSKTGTKFDFMATKKLLSAQLDMLGLAFFISNFVLDNESPLPFQVPDVK